jgi:DNA-binding transcriptional regulator YhcF (GntR family)
MAQNPRIRIDPASDIPVVRQIADRLRVLFVEGQLVPGTRLPSVRRLAIELGVHFNTVAEAYRILAAEGWLDVKHGHGAVVVQRVVPDVKNEAWTKDFRNRLRGIMAQTRSQGVSAASIAAELRAMAKEVTRT